MDNCETIETQQLRRMQELQQEKERLSEQLAGMKAAADRRMVTIADLEEKCQALAAALEAAKEGERWLRREYDLLAAQMEIVQLIFGGNKCGGCG